MILQPALSEPRESKGFAFGSRRPSPAWRANVFKAHSRDMHEGEEPDVLLHLLHPHLLAPKTWPTFTSRAW